MGYLIKFLAIGAVMLVMTSSPAHSQNADEKLAAFYESEFKAFNTKFDKIVNQLDLCLKEMDRFEAGDWLLDSVECPKFNNIQTQTEGLISSLRHTLTGFRRTLGNLMRREYSGKAYDQALVLQNHSVALMQIYLVKFNQVHDQDKRIQKLEGKITKQLEKLLDTLKKIRDSQNQGT
jgi:uncharacterized protein Yka (UPF0111/DUF47 family)